MNFIPQDLRSLPVARPSYLTAGHEPLAEFAVQHQRLADNLASLKRAAGPGAEASIARLQQELAAFEPAVTILGQVKSGKTTLVNALAGWSDLLPSDVNPWTSVVTSLHLSPGAGRQEIGARFQLMKLEEWDRLLSKGGRLGELAQRADAGSELETIRLQIEAMREKSRKRLGKKFELLLGQEHEYGYFDRNLLERYICLGDDFQSEGGAEEAGKQGWFADITRSADLYLRAEGIPFPLCLRDTPGVNDTFLMREQVTIGAVRDSRVCVVVLSAHQALTSTDMGLIRLISNMKSRDVIIFVNRIDELQNPAVQCAEIEKSIRETLARHHGPQGVEIIFGSAFWANKVLAEDIGDLGPVNAAALVGWAEAMLQDAEISREPGEMVWHLSGLPRLNRAIARHLAGSLGLPHLRKIASAAVTIAGGVSAAHSVKVAGRGTGQAAASAPDLATLTAAFDALISTQTSALDQALQAATAAYQDRAGRAHGSFLERATHSLVRHLEEYGEKELWAYDPNGLRILLKSAYAVYATRAASAAKASYQAAVEEAAVLLYDSFGEAVSGIELALPDVPEAPAPVALAQTIILDFSDGWWQSWWRRTRGYKAFSEKFYAMIAAETEDFIAQFKTIPPRDYTAQLSGVLREFLNQSREIALAIGQGQAEAAAGNGALVSAGTRAQQAALVAVLADLRALVQGCGQEREAA